MNTPTEAQQQTQQRPTRLNLRTFMVVTPEQESPLSAHAGEACAALKGPTDARWVLATLAARAVDNGASCSIPAEARQQLMQTGQRMGLRPFDVQLIIAIVQDQVRRGTDPLGKLTEDRLCFIPPAASASSRTMTMAVAISAVAAVALASFAMLAYWFTAR